MQPYDLFGDHMYTGQWASSGTPTSAGTPSGTPVAPQSGVDQINSVDYLTNLDKISLIQQWEAELQTQSQLDAQATTYGVSSASYDSAVAALSTGLITAGAPSNWATIWPDGTTSGPWTGVMTSLQGWWSTISSARAALTGSINAAINATATNALNLAPAIVASLPTLPSSSYPANKMVFRTSDNTLWQVNAAGAGWQTPSMQASLIIGQLVAGQIAAGAIGVSQLAALLAITGTIQSNNYVPGTSSAAATGFWLSGTAQNKTAIGGSVYSVQFELGTTALFGGYPVATVLSNISGAATTASWGSITGSAAQAAPSGGWTGTMAMQAATFSGLGTFNAGISATSITATTGTFSSTLAANGGLTATTGTFASLVNIQNTIQPTGPTLGSNVGTLFISTGDTGNYARYGMMIGVSGIGDTWLQSQRIDGPTTVYNLQIQPAGGSTIFGNGSGPVSMGGLTATTGTFSGTLAANGGLTATTGTFSGALTATTGTFSGQLQSQATRYSSYDLNTPTSYQIFDTYAPANAAISGGWNSVLNWPSADANYITQIANAMNNTGTLYRRAKVGGNWGSWYQIYDSGNISSNAAAIQAVNASLNAPMVGTYAQMVAFTPVSGSTPYWYATDVTAPDGQLGTLYQWNGSSWVSQGKPAVVVGRVTAGVISAGAVGAQAIAADFALANTFRSTAFTAGTTTAPPSGFKLTGSAFQATCYNGGGSATVTYPWVNMEIGGSSNQGVSIGGYDLSTLALARLVNGGTSVYSTPGTYIWICPPGITKVTAVVCGGGGGGAGSTGGVGAGGGGACIMAEVMVTPGTSYVITVGGGGTGAFTSSGTVTAISGGASSIVGGAVNISATGGGGGTASTNAGSALGGASGTASINGILVVAAASGANGGSNAGNANTISGIIFTTAVSGSGGCCYTGSWHGAGTVPGVQSTVGANIGGSSALAAGSSGTDATGAGAGAGAGSATTGYSGGPGYVRLSW